MSKQPNIDEIERALAVEFNYRLNICVPNVSWGMGFNREIDLLVLRQSGYAVEIEIKRSFADLKAELKKRHRHSNALSTSFRQGGHPDIKEFWFAVPEGIYSKAKEFITAHYPEAGILSYWQDQEEPYRLYVRRKIMARVKSDSRKWTDAQKMKLLQLAHMRIWTMKKKLTT